MGIPHRLRARCARSCRVRPFAAGPAAITGCLVVALVVGPAPRAAGATGPWQPPVRGPVVRGFVEPNGEFAPGHRGVDFAVSPGEAVRAAAAGTVTFAGDVAGALHVVVTHRNGLRTSYSFLLDLKVQVGDAVEAGAVVGHAGGVDPDGTHLPGTVHFGLRVGDRYVDPLVLFQPRDLAELVRLAPAGAPGSGGSWAHRSTADEAAELEFGLGPLGQPAADASGGCGSGVPVVGGVVHAVCRGVDWTAGQTRDALRAGLSLLRSGGAALRSFADRLEPELTALFDELAKAPAEVRDRLLDTPVGRVLQDLVEIGQRFLEWTQRECSKDARPADGTGGDGHLLMAVAGLESSTRADGSTFGLDTDALGYRRDDVSYYSYAEDGRAYTATDTEGDLRAAAIRLGAQLVALHAREPGRIVDLIAHSQGGVVVDWFLTHVYDPLDPAYPPITTVVTLASPHQGVPLATSNRELRSNSETRDTLDEVEAVGDDLGLDGLPDSGSTALRQLAEDSAFMRKLFARRIPASVAVTTIGGTDDAIVPANRIHVPGASEAVVDVAGISDHSGIVDDPRALQAVRAALEGRPPPCTSLTTGLRAAIEPVLLSRLEGDVGEYVNTYKEVSG